MAAVRHLGFMTRVLGPTTKGIWWPLSVITVQNLVRIDAVVLIMHVFDFASLARENAYSRSQIWRFGFFFEFWPYKWRAIRTNLKKAPHYASPRCLSHHE